MTETTNLKLTMDAPSEPYSVERVNANTEKIDAFAGETNTTITALQAQSMSIGTTIPEAADLDTYTTPGTYCSPSASRTASLVNSPTKAYGFRLEVRSVVNTRYLQILYPNAAGSYYMRSYLAEGWSSWYRFNGEEMTTA